MTAAALTVLLLLGATPELFDPGRAARPQKAQAEPPPIGQDPILAPGSSAPALVGWGESFTATVLLPPGAGPGLLGDWVAALSTRMSGREGELPGQPVSLRFSLEVEEVRPGPAEGTAVLTLRLSALPPREVYHLLVAGPGGLRGARTHAVRVLGDPGRPRRLRLAVIADHQLKDPSTRFSRGDLNNGAYPRRGDSAAASMMLQQVEELTFLDPDLVLHLGDLMFGTDYRQEYPQTLAHWWSRPLGAFMVPGNHDGLALYQLALKEGWWKEAAKSIRCAGHLLSGEVTAASVFSLLSCLFGDLKKILFLDLSQDGLDYWARYLGPSDYRFELGAFRFLGINSYSGTPERRHAFVLSLGFLGIDLGASPVDNYGGTLTDEQLTWIEGELEEASARGQTAVVFMHHDPRGNAQMPWGRRYHQNQPFPTEPLGLRKFQEWNYEGPEWDSDPEDGRGPESQTKNSAVRLLELLAAHASYVFSGHVHADLDEVVEAGGELIPGSGIRAGRRMHFSRVTTASATPTAEGGYWGYRLIEAEGPTLGQLAFCPRRGWSSVPAGNFFVIGAGLPDLAIFGRVDPQLLFVVKNGLPRPLTGLLRAYLPAAPEGYRFTAEGGEVELEDVGIGADGRNIYYLKVSVPAVAGALFPVPQGEELRVRVRHERAASNRTPVVRFAIDRQAALGRQVRFDGGATADPDGDPLRQYIWDFGDGHGARGPRAAHVYTAPGDYTVSLTAIDRHGAYARYSTGISAVPATSCSFSGAACAATSATLLLFALAVVLWLRARRRAG